MKRFVILFFIFCFVSFLYSTEGVGTTAFAFLKLTSGVRAQSMGENYVAVADNVTSIYYNPAGIGCLKRIELQAEYMLWSDILTKSNISFLYPKNKIGVFALGLDYINIPYEKRTEETDNEYESANVSASVLQISYAREVMDKILLGISYKFIIQDLTEGYTSNGNALDLGCIYRLTQKTNIGLSLQNIGQESPSKGDGDKLPMLLRLGQSTKLIQEKLLIVSDLNYGLIDGTISLGIGGEYKLWNIFYPRIGYKYLFTNNDLNIISGFNFGFVVKYKGVNLDYALSLKDTLGITHRVALGYTF